MPGAFSRVSYEQGEETFKIVTLDGGGLYGMFSTIMLRRLCEREPSFFGQDPAASTDMLAGTSAGALSALLIAQSDNPRELILSGGLEKFWEELGIFHNGNPVNWALSFYGLRAWLGKDEFLAVLHKYFGDRTFGDLDRKMKVLVLTFEWSGDEEVPKEERRWCTRYFSNFNTADAHRKIVDVAYAAASPPPFRALINGLGDAAIYACNPSMNAYAVAKARFAQKRPVALLSVGVGCRETYYWLKKFNLGALNFNMIPTNPMTGSWMPPGLQALVDAPTESTTINSKGIMGPFYFRLDPGVLGPPNLSPNTTTAILMSRNPFMHQWLLAVIREAAEKEKARLALDKATRFLQSPFWALGEASDSDWLDELFELVG